MKPSDGSSSSFNASQESVISSNSNSSGQDARPQFRVETTTTGPRSEGQGSDIDNATNG
jgi:hypothetical protein